jgi:hypothetical protein
MMMEAASTSETSVNFDQTARRNNPEDSHLQEWSRPCAKPIMAALQLRALIQLLQNTNLRLHSLHYAINMILTARDVYAQLFGIACRNQGN